MEDGCSTGRSHLWWPSRAVSSSCTYCQYMLEATLLVTRKTQLSYTALRKACALAPCTIISSASLYMSFQDTGSQSVSVLLPLGWSIRWAISGLKSHRVGYWSSWVKCPNTHLVLLPVGWPTPGFPWKSWNSFFPVALHGSPNEGHNTQEYVSCRNRIWDSGESTQTQSPSSTESLNSQTLMICAELRDLSCLSLSTDLWFTHNNWMLLGGLLL